MNSLEKNNRNQDEYAKLILPGKCKNLTEITDGPNVVDFDALLKERNEVETRLQKIELIDPEKFDIYKKTGDIVFVISALKEWLGKTFDPQYLYYLSEEPAKAREAKEYINQVFTKLLKEIKDAIQKECGTLGNFEALRQALPLLATLEESKKLKEAIESRTLSPDTPKAFYVPLKGKIYFNPRTDLNISSLELVKELSSIGFSESLAVIHHEKIHSDQYPPIPQGKFLKKIKLLLEHTIQSLIRDSVKSQTILGETQAYMGSGKFAGKASSHSDDRNNYRLMFSTFSELLGQISEYGVVSNKADIDKVYTAYDEIRKLYALGMSDSEIGTLVGKAKWERNKLRYDLLDTKISELMEQKNLSPEDVDDLVEAENIKSAIYWKKVKAIAKEKLQKFYFEQKELAKAREKKQVDKA